MKRIGMGGRQFFLSSDEFYKRHLGSLDTGRLRIEVSHYITSIEEEEEFLKGNLGDSFALIEEVAKHLRKHGKEHIRQIPFSAVWDAFWYT
jgi:hypothetical protein